MRPSKTRFVTACQQLLALGVVLAVLTPAATVISLDVVQRSPAASQHAAGGRPVADVLGVHPRDAARRRSCRRRRSRPTVEEYPLTAGAPASGKVAPGALERAHQDRRAGGGEPGRQHARAGHRVRRRRRHLEAPARRCPSDGADLRGAHPRPTAPGRTGSSCRTTTTTARTRTAPRRPHARPGTDVLLVGKVDEVQVRVTTSTVAPQPARHEARRDRARHAHRHRARAAGRSTTDEDGVAEHRRRPSRRADRAEPSRDDRRGRPDAPGGDVHARSRRSTRAPSGARTRTCATRARCTTSRCTPGSCTTR